MKAPCRLKKIYSMSQEFRDILSCEENTDGMNKMRLATL